MHVNYVSTKPLTVILLFVGIMCSTWYLASYEAKKLKKENIIMHMSHSFTFFFFIVYNLYWPYQLFCQWRSAVIICFFFSPFFFNFILFVILSICKILNLNTKQLLYFMEKFRFTCQEEVIKTEFWLLRDLAKAKCCSLAATVLKVWWPWHSPYMRCALWVVLH